MGFTDDVERIRAERDAFFRDHYASPLPDEHADTFAGLDYFPPDEAWVLPARFEPISETKVDVPSSLGGAHAYTQLGWATVDVGESRYALAVLDDGDGDAFIPFADATNGHETYPGGRYVALTVHGDGTSQVDFNEARNPYCAYDVEFVCPLPPASNRIIEPIRAGEMTYRAD
jgi:uncharacterized protein (DUF1684 family)